MYAIKSFKYISLMHPSHMLYIAYVFCYASFLLPILVRIVCFVVLKFYLGNLKAKYTKQYNTNIKDTYIHTYIHTDIEMYVCVQYKVSISQISLCKYALPSN